MTTQNPSAAAPAADITPEQGQLLAEAIGAAVIKARLVRPDALLTGPHLLQFVDDLASAHLSTVDALRQSQRTVDMLGAYGQAKFGDEWWPGNAQPYLGEDKGAQLEQLLQEHDALSSDLKADLIECAAQDAYDAQLADDTGAGEISAEHLNAVITARDASHLENEITEAAAGKWAARAREA